MEETNKREREEVADDIVAKRRKMLELYKNAGEVKLLHASKGVDGPRYTAIVVKKPTSFVHNNVKQYILTMMVVSCSDEGQEEVVFGFRIGDKKKATATALYGSSPEMADLKLPFGSTVTCFVKADGLLGKEPMSGDVLEIAGLGFGVDSTKAKNVKYGWNKNDKKVDTSIVLRQEKEPLMTLRCHATIREDLSFQDLLKEIGKIDFTNHDTLVNYQQMIDKWRDENDMEINPPSVADAYTMLSGKPAPETPPPTDKKINPYAVDTLTCYAFSFPEQYACFLIDNSADDAQLPSHGVHVLKTSAVEDEENFIYKTDTETIKILKTNKSPLACITKDMEAERFIKVQMGFYNKSLDSFNIMDTNAWKTLAPTLVMGLRSLAFVKLEYKATMERNANNLEVDFIQSVFGGKTSLIIDWLTTLKNVGYEVKPNYAFESVSKDKTSTDETKFESDLAFDNEGSLALNVNTMSHRLKTVCLNESKCTVGGLKDVKPNWRAFGVVGLNYYHNIEKGEKAENEEKLKNVYDKKYFFLI